MGRRGTKAEEPTPDHVYEKLERELSADDYRIRSAAVGVLGQIGDTRAVNLIGRALKDPRKRVRGRAVQALGRIRGAGALEALTPSLKDKTATVRKQAVDAIGKIAGVDEALELLLPMLSDSDASVACSAIAVCGSYCDFRTVEPLLKIGALENSILLVPVIRALAPLRDLRTVLFLCNTASFHSPKLSNLASRQLAELGDATTLPRSLLRADQLPAKYRFEALEALRRLNAGAWFRFAVLRYPLPPISDYCARMESQDPEETVRRGARQLLDHANLLRGSQSDRGTDLLRGASGPGGNAKPNELVRGSDRPDTAPPASPPGFWRRLFQWGS